MLEMEDMKEYRMKETDSRQYIYRLLKIKFKKRRVCCV